MTLYKQAVVLPMSLPFDNSGLDPLDDNIVNRVHYLFAQANAGDLKHFNE